ncbi:MAG: hypothetical protein M0R00_05210 [Candidatus Omnitrophica bacterium]|nr:hypothetical protein [Candidatus Omnitrophota bacterium]
MNNYKNTILITLFKILETGKKHYAAPSVNSIIKTIARHHNKMVGRRWLFQCLADLEEAGYITRQKRYDKNAEGKIEQIPSLWTFTLKGAQYLYKKCVAGAGTLVKTILSWLNRGDKRWPTSNKTAPKFEEIRLAGGLTAFKDILPSLLKS